MNIDASTIKQLLQLQMLNQMDLITSGSAPDNNSTDQGFDFAAVLQTLLSGQNTADVAGSSQLQSPAALSAVGIRGSALDGLRLVGADRVASPALAAGSVQLGVLRGRFGLSFDPTAGKPSAYDALIMQASGAHGVDPSLIKAVIHQESSFNPHAVSTSGAKGLMQLMDDTGAGLGVTDPFDPQQNVEAGTRFLAYLLHKYNGNTGVALAAYNAGPGRVDKLGIRTDEELSAKLHLLPFETQHYVPKVLGLQDGYAASLS